MNRFKPLRIAAKFDPKSFDPPILIIEYKDLQTAKIRHRKIFLKIRDLTLNDAVLVKSSALLANSPRTAALVNGNTAAAAAASSTSPSSSPMSSPRLPSIEKLAAIYEAKTRETCSRVAKEKVFLKHSGYLSNVPVEKIVSLLSTLARKINPNPVQQRVEVVSPRGTHSSLRFSERDHRL